MSASQFKNYIEIHIKNYKFIMNFDTLIIISLYSSLDDFVRLLSTSRNTYQYDSIDSFWKELSRLKYGYKIRSPKQKTRNWKPICIKLNLEKIATNMITYPKHYHDPTYRWIKNKRYINSKSKLLMYRAAIYAFLGKKYRKSTKISCPYKCFRKHICQICDNFNIKFELIHEKVDTPCPVDYVCERELEHYCNCKIKNKNGIRVWGLLLTK